MSRFSTVSLTVDGSPVSSSDEELEIGDISEDMIRVSAQVAYWGAVWAAAEAEKTNAEAAYRHWAAEQVAAALHRDPKLAEWKAKAAVESQDLFLKLKSALALAEHNVVLAKTRHESFKVKAATLQSVGARDRAGLASYVSTPKRPHNVEREERKSAMRTANKKKSGKKPKTND